jgi:hypothetical protein
MIEDPFRTGPNLSAVETVRLVQRADDCWPMARLHLIETCGVPPGLVDELHARDHIYTSFLGDRSDEIDLCFVLRDFSYVPRGVALQSMVYPFAPFRLLGTREAWFSPDQPRGNRLILTEGPLEAISYVALHRPQESGVLAMPSPWVPLSLLFATRLVKWEMIVAFGNSLAARNGFAQCLHDWRTHFGNGGLPKRVVPIGSTWNDDLRRSLRRGSSV